MRRSNAKILSRSALIALIFGTWTLASCDFLAGDGGGASGGPGVGGSSPAPLPAPSPPLATQRVSSLPPTEVTFDCYTPILSRDGAYAVFSSDATNLVGNDTNGQTDVFVVNIATGATERVNVSSANVEANNYSFGLAISGNGRHVVFYSYADNLVVGDSNFTLDAFVRDRDPDGDSIFDEPGEVSTVRVSIDSNGVQGNSDSVPLGISDDGRHVLFYSYSDNLVAGDFNFQYDLFVHDRDFDGNGTFDETGAGERATVRVSVDSDGNEANSSNFTFGSCISADGRYVAFYSFADNLIAGDTNGTQDAFVHDRDADGNGTFDETGPGERATFRVSVDSDENEANSFTFSADISGDGTQVIFYSFASNLVPGDNNGTYDVFVRNLTDGTTSRVSVATNGAEANSGSYGHSISDTGRYVVFTSDASNLVPGDTNFNPDSFVRDRDTDNNGIFDEPGLVSTTRLSVDSFLNPGNSSSYDPFTSADGSLVVFASYASNLVLGDSNGRQDIFLRDTAAGTTRRISQGLAPGGNGTSSDPTVDASGLIVAFTSSAANLVPVDVGGFADVFVRDVTGGPCNLVSVSSAGAQGNSSSQRPSLSANGRFVAFDSLATNLAGADGNGSIDVFVRDLAFGLTTCVSVDSSGVLGNGGSLRCSISSDGRFVAFDSTATNLVLSDTNGVADVFVHDRLTGTTTRVSIDSAGVQGNGQSIQPSISPDGRFVAFESDANNLVAGDTNGFRDIFVHDLDTGTTIRVSIHSDGVTQANSTCTRCTISADGLFIAWDSFASTLVTGDANANFDVFVHDRVAGTTTRVSVDSAGVEGDSFSFRPSISEDGRFVSFEALASNLVAGDTNGLVDIFRHDRSTGETIRVSVDSLGNQALGGSSQISAISADGSFVAFQTFATNLIGDDTEGITDIYLRGPMPTN